MIERGDQISLLAIAFVEWHDKVKRAHPISEMQKEYHNVQLGRSCASRVRIGRIRYNRRYAQPKCVPHSDFAVCDRLMSRLLLLDLYFLLVSCNSVTHSNLNRNPVFIIHSFHPFGGGLFPIK